MPPEWAGVEEKAGQVEKVDPAAIQGAADQFQQASTDAGDHSQQLKNSAAGLQGGVWDGPAADSFFDYVEQVGAAGNKVKDKLDEVAAELTELQSQLADIKSRIESRRDDAKQAIEDANEQAKSAIEAADAQATQFAAGDLTEPPNPDSATILADTEKANSETAKAADDDIKALLDQADEAIAKAQKLMKTEIGDGFSSVQSPSTGGATAPSSTGGINAGGSDGGGSGGGGSGGGGSGGGGAASGGMGSSGGPPSSGPPPGNVDSWIREAIKILKENGIPVTEDNIDEIWTIIEKESGGDPHAINNWDSNAAKGTPSKGLMQCIDPTFDAHKLPGHGDIYNPVDNIIAGVRYTFDRYGGFEGHPGLKAMSGGGGYQGY